MFLQLVKKLGNKEGAHLLVPEEDLVRVENQPKVNMEQFAQKLNDFKDKKRQKIQFLKECMDQKAVEECVFTPQLATRRKGETAERRNLDQFLEDQKRFEEMKKQKQSERLEEVSKQEMSQTLKAPYMN